jgi:hypothetical protein
MIHPSGRKLASFVSTDDLNIGLPLHAEMYYAGRYQLQIG